MLWRTATSSEYSTVLAATVALNKVSVQWTSLKCISTTCLVGSSCVFKFNFKYTWRSWGKICDLTKQTASNPIPPHTPSNKPSWKIRADQEDKTLILVRSEWWQEIQCGGDLTCIFTRHDLRGRWGGVGVPVICAVIKWWPAHSQPSLSSHCHHCPEEGRRCRERRRLDSARW